MKVLRDEAARSLAVAGVAAVLAGVPSSEVGMMVAMNISRGAGECTECSTTREKWSLFLCYP